VEIRQIFLGSLFKIYRQVNYEEGEKLAEKEGLIFFEVSAKTDENIKKMIYNAVSDLPFFDVFLGKNYAEKEKIISELGIIFYLYLSILRIRKLQRNKNRWTN